jgi:type II secretory pathway pseudopilin PulG
LSEDGAACQPEQDESEQEGQAKHGPFLAASVAKVKWRSYLFAREGKLAGGNFSAPRRHSGSRAMHRIRGFTILELCLAIAIALMLLAVAVPSMSGLFAEQKLRSTFEEFDALVRQAQSRSVSERRDYVLLFGDEGITLEPFEMTEEDEQAEPVQLAYASDTFIAIERPVALVKKPRMEWMFWRSGNCEPVIASYSGPAGSWSVKYNPLTTRGTFIDQEIK